MVGRGREKKTQVRLVRQPGGGPGIWDLDFGGRFDIVSVSNEEKDRFCLEYLGFSLALYTVQYFVVSRSPSLTVFDCVH